MATRIGTTGNDLLIGTSAPDELFGLAGNDTLNAAGGVDRMEGGSGTDWYYVDHVGDEVAETDGTGGVFTAVSYTLAPGVVVGRLATDDPAGTSALALTGNELPNTIFANAGNTSLYGGAGADVLYGGPGGNNLDGGPGADTLVGGAEDWFFVDTGDVLVIEPQGSVLVFARGSFTLQPGISGPRIFADPLEGTAPVDLAGNELGNELWGNAGNNVLNGRGGKDAMYGLAGDDTFFVDDPDDFVHDRFGLSEGMTGSLPG